MDWPRGERRRILKGMNSSRPPSTKPPRDRRAVARRSGTDRREADRRAVADRRYNTERRASSSARASSGAWLAAEPPAEHLRNAIQLLAATLDDQSPLTHAEFAQHAQAALARLTLALAALEGKNP